jgi:AcrR family transcriptional regulator
LWKFIRHADQRHPIDMQQQQDETSIALLAAAHRLLAEQGSEALTVRRIATEAGMSTMNVYSRFGGKDGVVDELYRDGFDRLFAAINSVPQTDDFANDLMSMAHAYRQFALDHPTYYKVMFRSAIHDFTPSAEATEVALAGLQVFVERISAGQDRGVVRNDDSYPATEIAAWLWASCHGLVSLELFAVADERVTWESVFDNGMRTAIAGLQPSAAHQG